jgi:hypothetical protein
MDTFSSYKNITLKDAIFFLFSAWNDVIQSKIINSFRHAKWYSAKSALR